MELRLSVGGDPDGGWLVDIHDGDRSEVYRPPGESVKTVILAAVWSLCQHDPSLHGPWEPQAPADDLPVPAVTDPAVEPRPADAPTMIERIETEAATIESDIKQAL